MFKKILRETKKIVKSLRPLAQPLCLTLLVFVETACQSTFPTPLPPQQPTSTLTANLTPCLSVPSQATVTPESTALFTDTNGILLAWRGVTTNNTLLPCGVDLPEVSRLTQAMLAQDPTNPLANWVLTRLQTCQSDYDILTQFDYKDLAQSAEIITAADNLLANCNPRLYAAYARKRWAQVRQGQNRLTLTSAEVSESLAGLTIIIYSKNGLAFFKRPEDIVTIEVQNIPAFNLDYFTRGLSVADMDTLFGKDGWQVNPEQIVQVPGTLYPPNLPEPPLPSLADLSTLTTLQLTLTPNSPLLVREEDVLLAWRGLSAAGTPLPNGVDLREVSRQTHALLAQDPSNPVATWLLAQIKTCFIDYFTLKQSDYQDPTQLAAIIAAADTLLANCNPRLYEAYAYKRWAQMGVWVQHIATSAAEAPMHLAGLTIKIYSKDGPAGVNQPKDIVTLEVQAIPEFSLDYLTLDLPVSVMNTLFGEGGWQVNPEQTVQVPGVLYPADLPEPPLPEPAELVTPTAMP